MAVGTTASLRDPFEPNCLALGSATGGRSAPPPPMASAR